MNARRHSAAEPRMRKHFINRRSSANIALQHAANKIQRFCGPSVKMIKSI